MLFRSGGAGVEGEGGKLLVELVAAAGCGAEFHVALDDFAVVDFLGFEVVEPSSSTVSNCIGSLAAFDELDIYEPSFTF